MVVVRLGFGSVGSRQAGVCVGVGAAQGTGKISKLTLRKRLARGDYDHLVEDTVPAK